MAAQMPFSGLLFMHKLVRISTFSQRHLSRHILHESRRVTRAFSTASVNCNENKGDISDSSVPSTKLTSRQELLSRRRRPLSPLERISSLLPQDALSDEVMQLREQTEQEDTNTQVVSDTQEEGGHAEVPKEDDQETQHASDAAMETKTPDTQLNSAEKSLSPTPPGERLLEFGELLVAEYHKKGRVEFRKMFKLQPGTRLMSSWGIIMHKDIAGLPAGSFLKTSKGDFIFIRRSSLEDYVLFMKRGPAITYPKDAATMLMMMDITEGDYVLESGSGSGAMSLFLSRAVGSKGSVLSVEVREDHHKIAMFNYKRWRKAWSLRRGDEWPDNVHFHNTDLRTESSLLTARGFNAVALDMVNPHLVLPTVFPHLHNGAVCAVYIAKCYHTGYGTAGRHSMVGAPFAV
ncbi:tRNA (adenine(58)-N(1))-methyltransferase, mitochondrial isoform X1 [Centropristis striata]|uniref:tRNA (adenine(58)-N(1))-methyltransferase, mitochondrial isoform X1 n=1 Tax=Centropristis striata TaxID=184440 RepID=UPI0027E042B3|nr:tRNA (adenine(58)-N(1))-methyltransferase, mitochondrial isoform X1 [Centropristis striata]